MQLGYVGTYNCTIQFIYATIYYIVYNSYDIN